MREGTSVEKHLKGIKELTGYRAASLAPIDEDDQIVTLLESLSKSYSMLVTALGARRSNTSLNYVQQAFFHMDVPNCMLCIV